MTDDPYDVLGVARTAKKGTIKRAYRRLSMGLHPDRNPGRDTSEEFQRVHRAYRILSDDERRARYDRTGEAGDQVDNAEAAAVNLLLEHLVKVTLETTARDQSLEGVDVVKAVRRSVTQFMEQPKKTQADLMKLKQGLEKVVKRLRRKEKSDGDGLLPAALRHQLGQVEENLRRVEADLDRMKRALDYLGQYTYDVDTSKAKPTLAGALFQWTATTSTTT